MKNEENGNSKKNNIKWIMFFFKGVLLMPLAYSASFIFNLEVGIKGILIYACIGLISIAVSLFDCLEKGAYQKINSHISVFLIDVLLFIANILAFIFIMMPLIIESIKNFHY